MSDGKNADKNKKEEMSIEEAKKRFSFRWFVNTPQKRTYTLLGVTFITFALLMWFAVRPTIETILELNNKIKMFKETAQELEFKYQNLLRLTDQYQKPTSEGGYKEAIEFFDVYVLPNTGEIPVLIANINEYSKITGVTLKTIQAGEVKESSSTKSYSFIISVDGSLEDIGNFIGRLEAFPRLLRITNVSIISNSNEFSTYSADITFETYSYISNPEELDQGI